MWLKRFATGASAFLLLTCANAQTAAENDPIQTLVGRLDLQRYKTTIRGLTQFGDRRQGTDRNRAAVDWIEEQLKNYGCTNTERVRYNYLPPAGNRDGIGRELQRDDRLHALNAQPSRPGPRQEVFCTKVGATHPEEMYIIGAHMDGVGFGEAANDDGSGTALVMEIARILSAADVVTDRSVRFVLWNNEETGLDGALAYVNQRKKLQGKENPKGSGKYPEPKWLGVIEHDMMLFDHGPPLKNGSVSGHQSPEADVNIEFQSRSKLAAQSAALALFFQAANEKYATDYRAAVSKHMSHTDSALFQDLTPAISLRELERGSQIGAGWDPTYHEPIDVYSTFSESDFRLGLNATQTTLGAIAQLVGAKLK